MIDAFKRDPRGISLPIRLNIVYHLPQGPNGIVYNWNPEIQALFGHDGEKGLNPCSSQTEIHDISDP